MRKAEQMVSSGPIPKSLGGDVGAGPSLLSSRGPTSLVEADRRSAVPGEHFDRLEPEADRAALAMARRMYRLRRRREAAFGPELFSDPAWDILLVLYIARREGRPVSVSDACLAAAAAQSTALRWIRQLEQEGLVVREGDPADARRSYVRLSSGAFRKMRNLLKEGCCEFAGESYRDGHA